MLRSRFTNTVNAAENEVAIRFIGYKTIDAGPSANLIRRRAGRPSQRCDCKNDCARVTERATPRGVALLFNINGFRGTQFYGYIVHNWRGFTASAAATW